jgi:putative PIN family toxin of toxin-antitoxin system
VRLTLRVVLDTNVIVRAMLNIHSPSGMILKACESRRIIPLLSRPVLLEYHQTLDRLAAKFPQLASAGSRSAFERLTYIGEVINPAHVQFPYARDPRDTPFIKLAIASDATHLITRDADLLDLQTGHDPAAKRFRRSLPKIEVITADQFVKRHAKLLSEN